MPKKLSFPKTKKTLTYTPTPVPKKKPSKKAYV